MDQDLFAVMKMCTAESSLKIPANSFCNLESESLFSCRNAARDGFCRPLVKHPSGKSLILLNPAERANRFPSAGV